MSRTAIPPQSPVRPPLGTQPTVHSALAAHPFAPTSSHVPPAKRPLLPPNPNSQMDPRDYSPPTQPSAPYSDPGPAPKRPLVAPNHNSQMGPRNYSPPTQPSAPYSAPSHAPKRPLAAPTTALPAPPIKASRPNKPPRSQRKAAARRASIMAAAKTAATESALWDGTDHRALTSVQADHSPSTARRAKLLQRRSLPTPVRLWMGEVIVLCGIITITIGLPIQQHGVRVSWLIAGVAAVIAGIACAKKGIAGSSNTSRLVAVGVVAILITSLIWGISDSVVIAGKVAPDSSVSARSYRLSGELTTDMYTMATDDHLVTDSQSQARSNYQQYATAILDLKGISKRWLAAASGPQPTPAFTLIETNVGNAAYWEADAMSKKAQDVVTPDQTVEEEINSERNTYVAQLLAAGKELRRVATLYGFKLASAPA